MIILRQLLSGRWPLLAQAMPVGRKGSPVCACLLFITLIVGPGDRATMAAESECRDCGWVCCECDAGPKTLFQWGYGGRQEGGAPLDEPLVTDRPDFTESSTTVGRGVLQLEMGYTYAYRNRGVQEIGYSYPDLLVRAGVLFDWLELRLDWAMLESHDGVTGTAIGSSDLGIGFKIALTAQQGILPEMALIPQMSVPAGSAEFRDNEVLPGLIWIYSWQLNDWLATAGQTQLNRGLDSGTGDPYWEFSQSWTVAVSLSDRWGGYAEWFVLTPDGATNEVTQHFVNGGFTFLVSDDCQLDIRYGEGLSRRGEDYFMGMGLSVRF